MSEAATLESTISIPFYLHRRILCATNRRHTDKQLVAEVADRLPAGSLRRRFMSFQKKLAQGFLTR